jgi:hypothetical protein
MEGSRPIAPRFLSADFRRSAICVFFSRLLSYCGRACCCAGPGWRGCCCCCFCPAATADSSHSSQHDSAQHTLAQHSCVCSVLCVQCQCGAVCCQCAACCDDAGCGSRDEHGAHPAPVAAHHWASPRREYPPGDCRQVRGKVPERLATPVRARPQRIFHQVGGECGHCGPILQSCAVPAGHRTSDTAHNLPATAVSGGRGLVVSCDHLRAARFLPISHRGCILLQLRGRRQQHKTLVRWARRRGLAPSRHQHQHQHQQRHHRQQAGR